MQSEFSMPYQTGAKMPQNSSHVKNSSKAKLTTSISPPNIEGSPKEQN
ncbi:hypothetical protein H6F93_09145 [Leptolyngbya sp. FACHB-671]|nr:hypothetical protein [Leptolyngbya sp. FACHB-671]